MSRAWSGYLSMYTAMYMSKALAHSVAERGLFFLGARANCGWLVSVLVTERA